MDDKLENLDEILLVKASPVEKPKKLGRPREMPEGKQRSITLFLPEDMHSRFKMYCVLRNLEMSKLLRAEIERLIASGATTREEYRQERFDQWVKEYQKVDGAKFNRVLEMFREFEADESVIDTEGEVK